MQRLFMLLAVALLSIGLVLPDHAEARRLGGGKSFGFQRSPSYSQPAQPQSPARMAPQGSSKPAAGGASRWLGPLAGLAAGGLIGALLFGGAFEGLQFLDLLLFAGIAFAIFAFMRKRRAAQPAMAGAGAGSPAGYARDNAFEAAPTAASSGGPDFAVPEIGSGLRGEGPSGGLRRDPTPTWFEEEAFVQAARGHFVRLQAAWDAGDMKDLREYTTPELFAALTLDRQDNVGEDNFTEVVDLQAELVGFENGADHVLASVRYSGLIRETRGAEPQPFSEVWHIRRAGDEENANWYVAGIQQD